MNKDALTEAIRRLVSHGDAMDDMQLSKLAASKKAKPAEVPAMCPECKEPLVDGKCEKCGYSEEAGNEDMASLLEQGAKE